MTSRLNMQSLHSPLRNYYSCIMYEPHCSPGLLLFIINILCAMWLPRASYRGGEIADTCRPRATWIHRRRHRKRLFSVRCSLLAYLDPLSRSINKHHVNAEGGNLEILFFYVCERLSMLKFSNRPRWANKLWNSGDGISRSGIRFSPLVSCPILALC